MGFWVNLWLVCCKRIDGKKSEKKKRFAICEIGGRGNAEGDEMSCIPNHHRLNFKSCSFFSSFDFNSGTLVLWDESSWMWLQMTIIQCRLPE